MNTIEILRRAVPSLLWDSAPECGWFGVDRQGRDVVSVYSNFPKPSDAGWSVWSDGVNPRLDACKECDSLDDVVRYLRSVFGEE